MAGCLGLLLVPLVAAAPIAVPNGDFSDPDNDGSIGGLLGPDLIDEPIGAGPWNGTSRGILGLLARPTLTIDSAAQSATVSGLLAVNVAGGLLNNGGAFVQQLGTSYQFGHLYILSAELDAGSPLDLGLLGATNVGIGLAAMGNDLATSATVDPALVHLEPLGGDSYRLRFGYVADIAASGFIGLRLFNEPDGLALASLLPSVSFSNVELESREIGPPDAVVVVPGDPGDNEAEVGTPFPGQFIAIVEDGDGNGVPGFAVTISAPLTGASAELISPTSNDPPGPVIVATTDLDGMVSFDAIANGIAGCYRVLVEAVDPGAMVSEGVFHFRNYSGDTAQDSIFCNGYQ